MAQDFRLISLDTETGGLDPTVHSLLSIGAVDIEKGTMFYGELIPTSLCVTPQAMAVNKLDLTGWNTKTDFRRSSEEIGENFLDFLSGTREVIFTGMNIAFDVSFLRNHLSTTVKRIGFRHLDLNSLIVAGSYSSNVSFHSARSHYSKSADIQLQEWLVGRHTPVGIGAHNALYDALFNCFLLARLVEKQPDWMKA